MRFHLTGRAMIVCVCKQVSERDLDREVARGCRSVADVARSTGAGTDCGCCGEALREAVAERLCSAPARVPRPMDLGLAAK
ncbi:MAG: (2Fe-2S)-binding protein [Alphaproteobacteria bacterium]|nr:(2Fe-2S)-binding protein [Alphaproteobacteria bacterium]